MTIRKASSKDYASVNAECIYDYILHFVREIHTEIEPEEDSTGNSYKEKRKQFANLNKTQLNAVAAELETVKKRLDYILYGKY